MAGRRSKRYHRYRRLVWLLTNQAVPARPGYTRDHIVPVSLGFKLDIPPEKIASLENIELVPLNVNIEKGTRLTDDALRLLIKWGYEDYVALYKTRLL